MWYKFKRIIEPLLFLQYMIRYANKKVPISFVEVWVGQSCTLKCRECLHLIPYIPQRLYNIEDLIIDCKKLFSICDVDYFSIVGGEPLTNKELYKLIDFINDCPNIKDGKLITNGTILPNERLLQSLKQMNGKLDVRIDSYPGAEEKAKACFAVFQKNGIRSTLLRHDVFEEMRWKWLGGLEQSLLEPRTSQAIYTHCALKGCYSMAESEFVACPRGITTERVFGLAKNKWEHVFLNKLPCNAVGRALLAISIDQRIYKDYCRYCLGVSKLNPYSVDPGIQLESVCNYECKNKSI